MHFGAAKSVDSRKRLELRSPMGAGSAFFQWPLTSDELAELLGAISRVRQDHPEIFQDFPELPDMKELDFKDVSVICAAYNLAVKKNLSDNEVRPVSSRVTPSHLKQIIRACYARAVPNPRVLNKYRSFSPGVYGESSFELVETVLKRAGELVHSDRFVDLGSGVGQVVLQVAALTSCALCLGIESRDIPAGCAQQMERLFKFWMTFHGYMFSPFKLIHGDFFDKANVEMVTKSTVIFVNNHSFGAMVNQRLKLMFEDLQNDAKIISGESFCNPNFVISDRNLDDLDCITHVVPIDFPSGYVSWTNEPVTFYLHTLDRAKLERYFEGILSERWSLKERNVPVERGNEIGSR